MSIEFIKNTTRIVVMIVDFKIVGVNVWGVCSLYGGERAQ